jgi:CPA2 family monovalent cation:H+ antiporter-2
VARAAAVVVTFADVNTALRVLAHVHSLNPAVPVIARARDESDIARLAEAGATEVVPEAFESGVMLASHTLVVVGVPFSRVMRRVSQVRDEQYSLLRGLFTGSAGDGEEVTRLHAVTLEAGAHAIGREVSQLDLGASVRVVRRPGARLRLTPAEAGALQPGDIVVLLGSPDRLLAAEEQLLRG